MSELTHDQLQEFARRENIRVPILSHKVVGDRVELHLLGGVRVVAPLHRPVFDESALSSFLVSLPVSDLRKITSVLDVPYRSKMNKVQLLDSILHSDFEIEDIKAALIKAGFDFNF